MMYVTRFATYREIRVLHVPFVFDAADQTWLGTFMVAGAPLGDPPRDTATTTRDTWKWRETDHKGTVSERCLEINWRSTKPDTDLVDEYKARDRMRDWRAYAPQSHDSVWLARSRRQGEAYVKELRLRRHTGANSLTCTRMEALKTSVRPPALTTRITGRTAGSDFDAWTIHALRMEARIQPCCLNAFCSSVFLCFDFLARPPADCPVWGDTQGARPCRERLAV